jgi:hypothetical protein
MPLSRIAGGLVAGAAAFLAATLVIALGGGSVSVRGDGPGSLTLTAALLLLGGGLLILAIVGPPPFDGRIVRSGFAFVVAGGAAELATANASASSSLIYVFLLGGLGVLLGTAVTGIGLLRSPGRTRWVGLTFVAGIALAIVAGSIANDPSVAFSAEANGLRTAMAMLATAAAGLMLAGLSGIGVLAWLGKPGDGPAPASAPSVE